MPFLTVASFKIKSGINTVIEKVIYNNTSNEEKFLMSNLSVTKPKAKQMLLLVESNNE
jgi:hypothetical protein